MEGFLGGKKKPKKEEKVVGLTRRQLLKGVIKGGIAIGVSAKFALDSQKAKSAETPNIEEHQEAVEVFKHLDIDFWRKFQIELVNIDAGGNENLENLKNDVRHVNEIIDNLLKPTADAGVEDLDVLSRAMRVIKPLIANVRENPEYRSYEREIYGKKQV